jgi:hypothetical protein
VANNTVTLTFKVTEDGKLKQISQDAEKAAASTKKAGAAADSYNRKQKGVAGATSNSTKAFSKMQQNLGGSNGLVAAYAGLAANIFALTAGFGALSRAARANQLESGLLAMGQATGVAMHSLSRGLVEATGNAISLEEAMRSVALITSAGIDPSAIDRFGQVAKKAATALGRDVQDSINRLTRGVTKLEPELLDELGIMVRLDEASKTYADSIGKTASELTNFEKRQAFLNATLAEGEAKFGALGDVDVNPYDKLAAALQNLAKSGIGGIAEGLAGIVGYLSEKPTALLGIIAAFGSTISQVVLGSLGEMTTKTHSLAKATQAQNKARLSQLTGLNRSSKSLDNVVKSMDDNSVSSREYREALDGQARSQKVNLGLLNKRKNQEKVLAKVSKTSGQEVKLQGISQQQYNQRIATSNNIIKRLNQSQIQGRKSAAGFAQSKAIAAIQEGKFGVALKNTRRMLRFQMAALVQTSATTKGYTRATQMASIAIQGLSMAAKTAGAAIMRMMGIVGMALLAFQMLADGVKFLINLFKSDAQKQYEEKSKALAEVQKELAGNLTEVDAAFQGQAGKIIGMSGAYTALSNTLSTFVGKYNELDAAGKRNGNTIDDQVDALDGFIAKSSVLKNAMQEELGATTIAGLAKDKYSGDTRRAKIAVDQFINSQLNVAKTMRSIAETAKAGQEAIADFINAGRIKTSVDEVLGSLKNLNSELFTVGADGVTVEIIPTVKEEGNLGAILSESLNADQARIFDVSKEHRELKAIEKANKDTQNKIAELTERKAGLSGRSEGKNKKRIDASIAILKAEMKAGKEQQDVIAEAMLPQLKTAQDLFALEQQRQVDKKHLLEMAKEETQLQKALAANTQVSAQAQINAHNAQKAAQMELNSNQIRFNNKIISGLDAEKLGRKLSVDEAKQLQTLQNQNAVLTMQNTRLEAEKTDELEAQVQLKKTVLAAVQENAKAEKAVLDNLKKQISEAKKFQKVTESIAKLEMRAANRASGQASGLTPSQIASIKLDKDSRARRITIIQQEYNSKVAGATIERAVTKARMAVLKAEIDLINQKRKDAGEKQIDTTELDAVINSLNNESGVYEQAMRNALLTKKEQLLILNEEAATLDVQKLRTVELEQIDQKRLEHAKSILGLQKGVFGEMSKQSDITDKLATLRNTGADGQPKSLVQAEKNAEESRQRREQLAKMEYNLKVATVKAEEALMQAKFDLLKAEMAASGGGIDANEAAALNAAQQSLNLTKQANEMKIKTAKMEKTLALETVNAERSNAAEKAGRAGGMKGLLANLRGTRTAEDQDIGKVGTGAITEGEKIVADSIKQGSADTNMILKAIADKLGAEVSTGEGATSVSSTVSPGTDATIDTISQANQVGNATSSTVENGLGGDSGKTITSEDSEGNGVDGAVNKLSTLKGLISATATEMALLGPEGEGASQVLNGALVMSEAFDKEADSMERAGAMISGLSSMMEGNSKMKIARIDQEIEAEKRRDGKSAESVAKLKALEKKKEAEQRKAFKRKKAMQMAQTVINTAAGIMEYMSDKNIPMAVATGILGAAQLAIISSQKYQGGSASAPSASIPEKASSGKRDAKVDLARGNNASGELAYSRGSMGTGSGATDFKPAFTGYKHRAEGGPTGFIVGEQGPELFMPQQPGDIIPAGQTEDITASAPTNVSFNISAVDSRGMEEMLLEQRGSIIGMIKEAANENGELFLEDVEEMTY